MDIRDAVFKQLSRLRQVGLTVLDDPKHDDLQLPLLEQAAATLPKYRLGLPQSDIFTMLLKQEIPRVEAPGHSKWLAILFGLKRKYAGLPPSELRSKAAKAAGDSVENFSHPGRREDQALRSLAARIIADCFQPNSLHPEADATPSRAETADNAALPHSPINPPTSHFTIADLGTLSQLVALPPRVRIRTHKGFLGSLGLPALRRHAAIAAHVMAEIDQTIRDNPALANLVKNDQAHAAVALSGGTATGARQAGREILYDSYDSDRTMAAALVFVGGRAGRRNAAVELKTLAQNQSRPIGPGRLDIVSRGILRLAGRNLELAVALYGMYQELSHASGRIDLGGRWNDIDKVMDADAAGVVAAQYVAKAGGGKQEQFMAQLQAYTQTLTDLTLLDGVSRTEPIDLVRGHRNQAIQMFGEWKEEDGELTHVAEGTLQRMLDSVHNRHRVEAAVILLEIHGVLAHANDPSRKLIERFFERRGLDQAASDFADALAAHTGIADLTAAELRAEARD